MTTPTHESPQSQIKEPAQEPLNRGASPNEEQLKKDYDEFAFKQTGSAESQSTSTSVSPSKAETEDVFRADHPDAVAIHETDNIRAKDLLEFMNYHCLYIGRTGYRGRDGWKVMTPDPGGHYQEEAQRILGHGNTAAEAMKMALERLAETGFPLNRREQVQQPNEKKMRQLLTAWINHDHNHSVDCRIFDRDGSVGSGQCSCGLDELMIGSAAALSEQEQEEKT